MKKEKLFYCWESDRVYSLSEIKEFYMADNGGHESFSDYLKNCMVENNGTLEEIKILYTISDCIVWNIKTDLL